MDKITIWPVLRSEATTRNHVIDLLEYVSHQSWRCSKYDECKCGLDKLTDSLGLDRVPRTQNW